MKLVAGLALAALTLSPLPAPAAAPFDFTDTLARGQTFQVRNINGDVTITPGNRLEVHAVKTAQHSNPDDVQIRTEKNANGLVVCVRYPGDDGSDCGEYGGRGYHHRNGSDNDTRVDFTIRVPSGVIVRASSVNGNVNVKSDALATATTVNGHIDIDAADVSRATSVNGTIDVRVRDGRSSEPLRVTTVNGSVNVTLPKAVGVNVQASVLNGGIDAAGLPVHRRAFGPGANVDGTLGDGRRVVELRALNGEIRLDRV